MALLQLFILILFCLISLINCQNNTCGSKNATKVALQTCTKYSQASCCTIEQDQSVFASINGTSSSCQNYYKAYLCEVYCAPEWGMCSPNCALCKSFCITLVQNCKSFSIDLPDCTGLQDTNCITPTNDGSVLITSARYFIYNSVFVLFILRILQSSM